MATADVDQKVLGRLARTASLSNSTLEAGLYQILGLSVRLSRQLVKARKLRRLDTSRDTKSLELYFHILWTSREGLVILEQIILPQINRQPMDVEYRVITAKLIASFYHIICLFNNSPPVSQAKVPMYTNSGELRMAMAQSAFAPSTRSASRASDARSATPSRGAPAPQGTKGQLSPTGGQPNSPQAHRGNGNGQGARTPPRRAPFLRDPTDSIQSDTSFVTNPYANTTPLKQFPPNQPAAMSSHLAPPPGLSATGGPAIQLPPISPIPHPAGFILPAQDYLPLTRSHFQAAAHEASSLPTNHPLRLSVALEHASFAWDCLHDNESARRIARRAIKEILQSREGMSDTDFQDAQALVAALGAIMRRKNGEGHSTSKTGGGRGVTSEGERKSSSGSSDKKKKKNGKR